MAVLQVPVEIIMRINIAITLFLTFASIVGAKCAASPVAEPLLRILPPAWVLPKPFAGTIFEPASSEQSKYARYLQETKLIPHRGMCEKFLIEQIAESDNSSPINIIWVVVPTLVKKKQTTDTEASAYIEELNSVTVANISLGDINKTKMRATFSCFAQYLPQAESMAWGKGFVKYSTGLRKGDQKGVPPPDRNWEATLPGDERHWGIESKSDNK